jgi:uncharacterized protein with FMN-binding domain
MSLATTAGLAGLFATMSRTGSAESAAVIVAGAATGSPAAASSSSPSSSVASATGSPGTIGSPAPTTEPATIAAGRPTVVDGAVFVNKWGPVQVEATFAPDGSLTAVTALQTPNDRSKSVRINDYAVPRLTSEALTAQTASVHAVSGATYTSDSYRHSLQSAIDAARAAGVTAIA